MIDDRRQVLRFGRERIAQLRRAQRVQLPQRRPGVPIAKVGVRALEERLVPVPRKSWHRLISGRSLRIPPHPVQRSRDPELRQLLHFGEIRRAARLDLRDSAKDPQRLLRVASPGHDRREILRSRVRSVLLRHALREGGCVVVAASPKGRRRKCVRGPPRDLGRQLVEELHARGRGQRGLVDAIGDGQLALQRPRIEWVRWSTGRDAPVVDGSGDGQAARNERSRERVLGFRPRGVDRRARRARGRGGDGCGEEDRDEHRGLARTASSRPPGGRCC